MSVVIVGGGIHGVSIAYFLLKKGIKSTIIERTAVAAAASGKSGGFLARDWGDGCTTQLHEKSFALHAQLATELALTSFRYLPTVSASSSSHIRSGTQQHGGVADALWLDGHVKISPMDAGPGTAQVTPEELVVKMVAALEAGGSEVLIDAVVGVELGADSSSICGVRTAAYGVVAADRVVFCMGPWTGALLETWFAGSGLSLPLEGIKSTSMVYRDVEQIASDFCAVFSDEDTNGCHLEIYPRMGGEVYICGCGGSDHVRGARLLEGGDCCSADLIHADSGRVEAAQRSLAAMSSLGQGREPAVVQACMRPCASDGLPVMSAIPGVEGAFVSAGHNCWGILWAPICGVAMAELLADGVCASVDLKPFSIDRFNRAGKADKRGRKKGTQVVGEQW